MRKRWQHFVVAEKKAPNLSKSRRIRYPVPDRIRSLRDAAVGAWERFLLDKLLAAIHAKLAPIHSPPGVQLSAALLDRNPFVDHLAAVRTAANGCI